jgi:Holliday junction DNA helicase RuvA
MMVARLRGTIEDIGLPGILVDVGGVGYPVLVSTRTRAMLPLGQPATLLIETQIREESVTYYGFIDTPERTWFQHLTTVQGVGGKVALSLLSVLDPDQLAQAILAQDRTGLNRADGVGPKLAIRLVTELKEKANAWTLGMGTVPGGTRLAAAAGLTIRPMDTLSEAVAALTGLQFKPSEAQGAVAAASRKLGDNATTNDLVRAALMEIGR